jgi:hypothetical protein
MATSCTCHCFARRVRGSPWSLATDYQTHWGKLREAPLSPRDLSTSLIILDYGYVLPMMLLQLKRSRKLAPNDPLIRPSGTATVIPAIRLRDGPGVAAWRVRGSMILLHVMWANLEFAQDVVSTNLTPRFRLSTRRCDGPMPFGKLWNP